MKILTKALFATAATLSSAQALAHPGDHSVGSVFSTLAHYLTQPDHLLFIGVSGVLAYISYRVYTKVKASR